MNNYYSEEELLLMGFKKIGTNALISKKSSFYSIDKISIGNNVRIDDFCILSGNITIKNNVHISAYTALYGGGTIEIGNYCGCSPRCTLLSANDDFSGNFMVGPMIPEKFTNVCRGKIILKDYSQIGANTVILPNVIIEEGVAVGSLSLVKNDLEAWGIYAGIPTKRIKNREKNILNLKKKLGEEYEV